MKLKCLLRWPRTLFARLALILVVGLAVTQALTLWLTVTERDQAMTKVMMGYIEREVTSSVALLDHLPAAERAQWLPRLARRTYTFSLDAGIAGSPPDAELSERVAQSISEGIGTRYPLSVNAVPGEPERLQVHLRLSDGTPLTIDYRPVPGDPLSRWLPAVLALQLVVLAACCWLAVRLATRPLSRLARAADTLGPDLQAERLPEEGPDEVVLAAKAFNAMQDRIKMYMTERLQILAAISHDLQTPITRMRLRVDLIDDEVLSTRLGQDLREMEAMVKEGITYARTMHGASEVPCRIDPGALLQSIVFDYVDAGMDVSLEGSFPASLVTRPVALRRIVGNLVDNALKFGGAAELVVEVSPDQTVTLSVLDRGPGIPEASLDAVFEPFYRLEGSRNRNTGGTGLGLAIARQLALSMDAVLTLRNRTGGGLEATLSIKAS